MRAAFAILICCLALPGCRSGEPESAAPDPAEARRALAGAPAPLAELHAQANELLDGGADAFRRRLTRLRGHPVVVNKWASWCAPCREEFPFLQRQSVERGREVAFIGVDSDDNDEAARRFLDR